MFALTKDTAKNLVTGAAILGTGGGGSPEEGLKLLFNAIDRKLKLNFISLEELSEDSLIVCPFYLGTVAPIAKTKKPVVFHDPMGIAMERMEKLLGKKVAATIAAEIGGFNTPIAIYIAASLGLPTLDADLGGRASPEMHQSVVNIFNIPRYPSIVTSETGNLIIVERYADIDDFESIARYLSTLAGKFVSVVNTPMDASTVKKVAVKCTISKCIEVGKVVKEANEKCKDPVKEVIVALNGYFLFKGIVKEYTWNNEGGFLIGKVIVEGVDEWKGHKFESRIKNEHIIAFRDNKPIVMPPDLISFLNEKGYAIMNSELKQGMIVNIIGARAPEVWRTPKGLELFGPRHFGFNYEYVPIEKLV
ncbi:DUF917 domain-containing protein [Thermococci archaeon]|nr:MAG: DUF917 domain-containing protein [Thermococci archaeon]